MVIMHGIEPCPPTLQDGILPLNHIISYNLYHVINEKCKNYRIWCVFGLCKCIDTRNYIRNYRKSNSSGMLYNKHVLLYVYRI